jgi:hypothetical protein
MEFHAHTDLSVYELAEKYLVYKDPRNDPDEIELYILTFIIHTVEVTERVFKNHQDEDFRVRMRLVSVRIDTPANRYDGKSYLFTNGVSCFTHMHTLIDKLENTIRPYDHGIFMTANEIILDGCTGRTGICNSQRYSLMRLRFFNYFDSMILLHELGHNVGMPHSKISNK